MPLEVHFAILHCYEPEDNDSLFESGEDECILSWNGQPFWQGKMKGGRDRDTDTFRRFGNQDPGFVELTEEDSPDPNDHLGTHPIRQDELSQGWHRAFFRSDEASYHLDYEVFNS
ncbi:hypothetical protein [Streptomyces europaeiscabiei]|uniref:hypothetical protein n=1 Tax=Streptomyces europaeiscabiei TaxID=146819 RepID=UPI0038F791BF